VLYRCTDHLRLEVRSHGGTVGGIVNETGRLQSARQLTHPRIGDNKLATGLSELTICLADSLTGPFEQAVNLVGLIVAGG